MNSSAYFDAKRALIDYANDNGYDWDTDAISVLATLACEYGLFDVEHVVAGRFTVEHCYKTRGWDVRAYRECMEEELEEYEEEKGDVLAQCL